MEDVLIKSIPFPDGLVVKSGMVLTCDSESDTFVLRYPEESKELKLEIDAVHTYIKPDSAELYFSYETEKKLTESPILPLVVEFYEYRLDGDTYSFLGNMTCNLLCDSVKIVPVIGYPSDGFSPSSYELRMDGTIVFRGFISDSPSRQLIGKKVTHFCSRIDSVNEPKRKLRGETLLRYDNHLFDADGMIGLREAVTLNKDDTISIYAIVRLRVNSKVAKITTNIVTPDVPGLMKF